MKTLSEIHAMLAKLERLPKTPVERKLCNVCGALLERAECGQWREAKKRNVGGIRKH